MGEETQFTADELRILGEEPPAQPAGGPEKPLPAEGGETLKPPEGEVKPEQKLEEVKLEETTPEEKQAMESMGLRIDKGYIVDDDGTKIPAKRWKSLYRDYSERGRTIEEKDRKFQLFKELGQEKYFELYPGETPAGWKPPEKDNGKRKELTETAPALGEMIVKGGPHDGKTLNQVWQEDPAYAATIQSNHLNAENQKVETERQTQERLKKESEDEVNTFTGQLARELFNKEPEKLTKDEEGRVVSSIQSIFDWMAKTKRGGGVLADAHFLMNREKHISDAKAKGGKEALESLNKPAIPSVSTGGGASVGGFSAYEEISRDQLATEVEKMSEKQAIKFFKEAPASLKAKHPDLPWT